MRRLKRLLSVHYLLGNRVLRCPTSCIPAVVHGPDQPLDRFAVSPSPCSRASLQSSQ